MSDTLLLGMAMETICGQENARKILGYMQRNGLVVVKKDWAENMERLDGSISQMVEIIVNRMRP